MARLTILLVAALGACSTAQAHTSPELAGLAFWPQPLASAALPLDSHETGVNRPAAQAADHAALREAADARLDAVAKEQALNGERSPALIDKLVSLAELYRELGELGSAAAALEDAIRIARINYGLYSLDQVDAVESLVALESANGDYAQAAAQREYLRDLTRRNADDPRIVGVLNGLAAGEMAAARELLDVPAPPQFIVNQSTDGVVPIRPPQKPALEALEAARSDYIATLQAALRTRTGNVRDWSALEDALADTVYFEYAHPELFGLKKLHATGRYVIDNAVMTLASTQILQNRVRDSAHFGLGPLEVAKAMLELGDWYLVDSAFDSALTEYELARDLVVKQNVPRETIDDLLSPDLPPVIPTPPANIAGAPRDRARGYIDASVEINRFGIVKRANVVAKSPGTSKAIEKGFRRYIESARFRPRFTNDELARSDRFHARFYFDY